MFNGLLFLNPKSQAQVYLLAGLGWSWAHATCDPTVMACPALLDAHYSYFGGQLGGAWRSGCPAFSLSTSTCADSYAVARTNLPMRSRNSPMRRDARRTLRAGRYSQAG